MEIKREYLPALWSDIEPLAMNHGKELGILGDHEKPITLNKELYQVLQDTGRLLVLTARKDAKLIGYVSIIAVDALHFEGEFFAEIDAIYLDPDYRKGTLGIKLIKEAEKIIKEHGIKYIRFSSTEAKDLSSLLKRFGYTVQETVYLKEI